jgi:hypothetical protein
LQSGIERAFLYLEQVVGSLLNVLDKRISMRRLATEGLEDHHFECTWEKISSWRLIHRH